MKRWSLRLLLIAVGVIIFPFNSPAPLIYRAGEGWVYERPGKEGGWTKSRAKDQLDVAEQAFKTGDHGVTLKAARRVVKIWPLSDYAPRAQYLIGRSYEAKHMDEKAFDSYQKVLEKYPKAENYDEVLARQTDIANRFLAGQWFKLWGYIPFFPSMDKTADMYGKIIKNGPYSPVAPKAQMNIGTAREKQKEFQQAVKAYEAAADRYSDDPKIAPDALFRAGLAYHKQARAAEYDQGASTQAIAAFSDFITLYPEDARVPEAKKLIAGMKYEHGQGSFKIAQFYEKKKQYEGALVYYNEVVAINPESSMATLARLRIEYLKKILGRQ